MRRKRRLSTKSTDFMTKVGGTWKSPNGWMKAKFPPIRASSEDGRHFRSSRFWKIQNTSAKTSGMAPYTLLISPLFWSRLCFIECRRSPISWHEHIPTEEITIPSITFWGCFTVANVAALCVSSLTKIGNAASSTPTPVGMPANTGEIAASQRYLMPQSWKVKWMLILEASSQVRLFP